MLSLHPLIAPGSNTMIQIENELHSRATLCSLGCGWWLVLICYKKTVLLIGW